MGTSKSNSTTRKLLRRQKGARCSGWCLETTFGKSLTLNHSGALEIVLSHEHRLLLLCIECTRFALLRCQLASQPSSHYGQKCAPRSPRSPIPLEDEFKFGQRITGQRIDWNGYGAIKCSKIIYKYCYLANGSIYIAIEMVIYRNAKKMANKSCRELYWHDSKMKDLNIL